MIELTELTAPAEMPVARADLMAHLRLGEGFAEPSGEEELIDRLIDAATAAVEARSGLALVARGVRLRVACWDRDGRLSLPIGPVTAIASASIEGPGGAMPFNGLTVDPGTVRQRLSAGGDALPTIPRGQVAVIEFTAGFGPAAADVPQTLREAVLLLAAHRYESRGEDRPEPGAIGRLIGLHRPIRL